MKHIFIANPVSGSRNAAELVSGEIKKLNKKFDCEMYVTKCAGDAENYIKEYLSSHSEKVRFYSCGGDGTLNETVNGVAPFEHGSFSVYPCGSGNDFVKVFGGKENFLDIEKLIGGKETKIDIMKVNDRYCINVCHFGFDSYVAKKMNEVRAKPAIGGKNAYTTGVVLGLLHAMKSKVTVFADGRKLNGSGSLLLCTVANGQYVGGKYKCAPRANICDGLLDVCLVDPVSRLTFVKLVNAYADGKHLDDPRFGSFVHYKQCRTVEITAERNFNISLDGEIIPAPNAVIKIIPNGINFIMPG